MTARYLIRLDDACETMDRERWSAIEELLDQEAIKPLVAIVPDNKDPELIRGEADPHFWSRVDRWQAKGWTIAMHGLHHAYHAIDRRKLLVPLHDRSEFAGLAYEHQAELIAKSWSKFRERGIAPEVWIAPGHSFDRLTIKALMNETPIRHLSDGLSINHFDREGMRWLPQQLWWPEPKKRGVWTICLHPNTMDNEQLLNLARKLESPYYRERITSFSELKLPHRRKGVVDRLYEKYFFGKKAAMELCLPAYHALKRMRAAVVK